MKILVTGGAGYIGSILVPELLEAGYSVTVLDSFIYRQSSLNHVCVNSRLEIVDGDIRDQSLIKKLIPKHDAVVPLAALVGAPLCDRDPFAATSVNRDSVFSMLKTLSANQWLLMPTTNSAYGTGGIGNFCDENSPLKPISRYAIDKVEIESAVMERENAISFRLATVFGVSPRMRLDLLVNDFTYRAVHDRFIVLFEPSFKRNYIHVRDVARAFMFSLQNFSRMKSNIYNVGLSDANISKRELCDVIKKQIPDFAVFEDKIKSDPDQRNYIVSNSKIEAAGFRTSFTLQQGIAELIKGFCMFNARPHRNA